MVSAGHNKLRNGQAVKIDSKPAPAERGAKSAKFTDLYIQRPVLLASVVSLLILVVGLRHDLAGSSTVP